MYDGGVRADSMWLDAFSRNGSDSITVMNPVVRLYGDMSIRQLAAIAGSDVTAEERAVAARLISKTTGKVGSLPATRYRIAYDDARIDYWTTTSIPENPQLRRIIHELLSVVSPHSAAVARTITGTPVYIEVTQGGLKNVRLVRMKRLTPGRDDEAEGLSVGRFYVKAPLVDALWR